MDRDFIANQIAMQLGLLPGDLDATVTSDPLPQQDASPGGAPCLPRGTPTLPPYSLFPDTGDIPAPRTPSAPCSSTGRRISASGSADAAVLTPQQVAALRVLADRVLQEGSGDALRASQILRNDPEIIRRLAAEVATARGAEDMATIMAITECTDVPSARELKVTPEHPGRYLSPASDGSAELGRGGIGRVMLMRDRHLGRDIAMKELLRAPRMGPAPAMASSDALFRFLREARITGQLEHPNIVPVHEVGQRPDGTLYYTMKLVRGNTFSAVLAGCKNLDDRLKLLPRYLDLCQAIAYAHSRGVIHRDIKPQNVMLGEFGETMVLDWGLAKVAGQPEECVDVASQTLDAPVTGVDTGTVMGTTMGTPAYMSPEQAAGAIDELDARSDVWSLGAVLYEMLSGQLPFGGGSLQSLLHKVMTQDPTPIRALDVEIPPDLASVCEKALQRRKEHRYASAAELVSEIESYLAGRRVQAHEYSSWQLVKRLVSRNKVASSLAGSILAILLASSVVIFGAYRQAEINRVRAVAEKVEANRQTVIAEESRDAEQRSRELAQKRETEANLNLSLALGEEAARLAHGKELLSAGIFASAALLYSPNNPGSPHASRGGDALPEEVGNEQMAGLQSLLFEVATESVARLERVLAGHDDAVSNVVFLPSGEFLLSASWDGNLRWWRPSDGSLVRTVKAHEGWIQGLAVSQDGTSLATCGSDDTIALWDAASGSILRRTPRLKERQRSVAFARNGQNLVSGGRGGTLTFWQLPALEEVGTVPVQAGEIRAIEWLPERDAVLVTGNEKVVQIVSLSPPYSVEATLSGHADVVYSVSLSADRKSAVSASHDGTVRIWDLDSTGTSVPLTGHKGHVVCSVFSPDGRLIASASHDRRINLWRVEDRALVMTLDAHDSAPRDLAFSPDGTLLASCGDDRTVRFWRIRQPAARTIHTLHGKAVYRVAYRPDGRALAAASLDGGISLWNPTSGERLASWSTGARMLWSIAFSPDGSVLYDACNDGLASARKPVDGTPLWSLRQASGRLHSVAPFPDGQRLAVAGEGVLRILESGSGAVLADLEGSPRYFWSTAVSPDSSLLASGDQDRRVVLWSTVDGSLVRELPGHTDWVSWVEFSKDGKTLVSSSKDATIRVFEVSTGRPLVTLSGHGAWVNVARLSPDGRHVLTGSDDNTVRIWEASTGRLLQSQKLDREESGAAFSPDGRHFAFADGLDVRVYPLRLDLWKTPPDELLRKAQEAQGKKLVGFELLPLEREAGPQ